jgi:hypothetical protein
VSCHEPLRKNDYVYHARCAGAGGSGDHILDRSAKFDHVDVVRNNAAIDYARTSTGQNYPEGAILTLVTWKQRPDDHWFGANIATLPETVETGRRGDMTMPRASVMS